MRWSMREWSRWRRLEYFAMRPAPEAGPLLPASAATLGLPSSQRQNGEPLLENLPVSFCRLAKPSRRYPGGAMKRAHEVGEVAESNVEGYIGNRPAAVCQETGRVAQPGANQVLMRCHSEDLGEKAKEVKGAEPSPARDVVEIDRLV